MSYSLKKYSSSYIVTAVVFPVVGWEFSWAEIRNSLNTNMPLVDILCTGILCKVCCHVQTLHKIFFWCFGQRSLHRKYFNSLWKEECAYILKQLTDILVHRICARICFLVCGRITQEIIKGFIYSSCISLTTKFCQDHFDSFKGHYIKT